MVVCKEGFRMTKCIWGLAKSVRHCEFCVVNFCSERDLPIRKDTENEETPHKTGRQ